MPTYEYECPECGHRLILSASITEMECRHEFCPRCPAEMRRVFSPPAVVFRGGGWASKS